MSIITPAVLGTAMKIVGANVFKVGGVALTSYAGFKIYQTRRFKSPLTYRLANNWESYGLYKEHKPLLGETKRYTPSYIKEERKEDYLYKAYFKLPAGMSLDDIRRKLPAIELNLNAEIGTYQEDEYCVMEISTGHLKHQEMFTTSRFEGAEGMELPIIIGESKKGLQIVDLGKRPHILVGGETGGGKSVFVRQALTSLMSLKTPTDLEIYMIDLKGGLEFQLFKNAPHVREISKEAFSAFEVLRTVEAEMDKRQADFYNAGVTNIKEYREAVGHIPYILLVIDELAELSPESVGKSELWNIPEHLQDYIYSLNIVPTKGNSAPPKGMMKAKDLLEYTHSMINRLLRLARALGIHLFVATQRPDAKVLPGDSKANIPITVAFRVRNELNSRILLGEQEDGAAKLNPNIPGRAILQSGHLTTEVQVPFLSTKKAHEYMEDMRVQYDREVFESSLPPIDTPPIEFPEDLGDSTFHILRAEDLNEKEDHS